MLDFLEISSRYKNNGVLEVSPEFIIKRSSDLMIRGRDFYAIWDEEQGKWSTDEDDAVRLIDNELKKYINEHYTGDVITHSIKRQNSESVNQNINISSSISIIANPFANKHCSEMTYITYMGAKWKISDISPEFPRLKLTIGDLYNGK